MVFFIICLLHQMLCLDDGMEHVVAKSCRRYGREEQRIPNFRDLKVKHQLTGLGIDGMRIKEIMKK
jgi:hypothetical protein